MKRFVLVALLLVVAACGDDDTATTATTAGPTTTGATTAAPTTEAPTTTAPTTTSPPTTEDPAAARTAAAAQFAGEYTGTWENTTFGSTGPADVTVVVDEAAQFMLVTIDLGGNVFGGTDPDPVLFELDLIQEPPYEFSSDLFGEATIDLSEDGTVTIDAPAIPDLGGLPMTVEGSFGGEMTYTIGDGAGGVFAEGVITVAPAG